MGKIQKRFFPIGLFGKCGRSLQLPTAIRATLNGCLLIGSASVIK
jgi:hypothetical protein